MILKINMNVIIQTTKNVWNIEKTCVIYNSADAAFKYFIHVHWKWSSYL